MSRMHNRIYIGSLNYELTEEHVKIPFETFGQVVAIDMPKVFWNNKHAVHTIVELLFVGFWPKNPL